MSARYKQLEDVARDWMNTIWTKKEFGQFSKFHHPQMTDMSPAGRDSNREAYEESIQALFQTFPNFTAFVEDIIVDELKGKSAIRWSASASQHGDFYGLKPTGKAIFFTGIEILAIDQDGLITERWGEWDGLSILEQITRSNETDAND
ncbi:MAG: hypothetical protein BGO78_08010 [Chloroflexi bacterium 44-23]|nr:MAG: hypothetical protein BGO78_08010 [Chloroflexi bacterium 44-23]